LGERERGLMSCEMRIKREREKKGFVIGREEKGVVL